MNIQIKLYLCAVIASYILAGCSSKGDDKPSWLSWKNDKKMTESSRSLSDNADELHQYNKNKAINESIERLAEQFFLLEKFDYQHKKIAVTNFVWANDLAVKEEGNKHKVLEHYISDSLKVEFVQRGCNVVEFQSSSHLAISDYASHFLSRDLNDLSSNVDMDYILVGTLLEINRGVVVNAQVIDIKTKEIVASAKEYIPTIVFHDSNKVFLKDNFIYRNDTRK